MSTEHILVPKAKYEKLLQKYNSSLKNTDKENQPSGKNQDEEIPKGVEPAKKFTERNDVTDQDHNSDFVDGDNNSARTIEEIISNHENFLPPGLPVQRTKKIRKRTVDKKDSITNKRDAVIAKRRNKPYSVIAKKWMSL